MIFFLALLPCLLRWYVVFQQLRWYEVRYITAERALFSLKVVRIFSVKLCVKAV